MSLRSERSLFAGLSLYALLILGSQATMSIGIGIVLVSALIAFGGPMSLFRAIKRLATEPELARYLRATNFVTLACLISLLGAKFYPLVIDGVKPDVHFVRDLWKAWYFYWPLMTVPCILALSPHKRKRLYQIYLGAFGIIALMGCFQFFTGWPRMQGIPGLEVPRFHVTGFTGFHLSFASIAIFPFFLAVSEIIEEKWISRKFAVVISIVGLLAIFGTYSRQVWISLPVGLFVFALVKLPKKGAFYAGVIGIFTIIALSQVTVIRNRVMTGMGIGERVELWKANTAFFEMRPLTGVGWHHNLPMAAPYYKVFRPELTSPFVGHAHSNFFEFLGGLGLIGVLAYLYWTWTSLRLSLQAGAGFFAAWIVFHLNGLTQVNLWESKVMHSMMWSIAMIVAALISKRRGEL